MSFYKCQKCQKAWQYPIERCPDCFSILERSLPGKAKVVGVSQVKVSTTLHPQTPFFALVLEDENGNRWTHKSSIEYKIGDEVEFSPSVDKNAVAIWRTKHDILEAIDNLVGLLGGLKIGEDSKILVLPSINSSKHPYLAENTSPQFLEAMIDYLLSKGAKSENIKIVAQSFNDVPAGVSATKSQLIDVCKNKKVEPIDLAEKESDFLLSEDEYVSDLKIFHKNPDFSEEYKEKIYSKTVKEKRGFSHRNCIKFISLPLSSFLQQFKVSHDTSK